MDIKAQSLFQEMQAMASQARLQPESGIPHLSNLNGNEGNDLQVKFSDSFKQALEKVDGVSNVSSRESVADMLGGALNTVNSMQLDSREKQQAFDMGDKNLSLVDVMVAKEKSGIAFEATVQVRNKLLEAYKQIMNMPV